MAVWLHRPVTSPGTKCTFFGVQAECRRDTSIAPAQMGAAGRRSISRIGDPSGRNKTQPPLSRKTIDANAQTYFDQEPPPRSDSPAPTGCAWPAYEAVALACGAAYAASVGALVYSLVMLVAWL